MAGQSPSVSPIVRSHSTSSNSSSELQICEDDNVFVENEDDRRESVTGGAADFSTEDESAISDTDQSSQEDEDESEHDETVLENEAREATSEPQIQTGIGEITPERPQPDSLGDPVQTVSQNPTEWPLPEVTRTSPKDIGEKMVTESPSKKRKRGFSPQDRDHDFEPITIQEVRALGNQAAGVTNMSTPKKCNTTETGSGIARLFRRALNSITGSSLEEGQPNALGSPASANLGDAAADILAHDTPTTHPMTNRTQPEGKRTAQSSGRMVGSNPNDKQNNNPSNQTQGGGPNTRNPPGSQNVKRTQKQQNTNSNQGDWIPGHVHNNRSSKNKKQHEERERQEKARRRQEDQSPRRFPARAKVQQPDYVEFPVIIEEKKTQGPSELDKLFTRGLSGLLEKKAGTIKFVRKMNGSGRFLVACNTAIQQVHLTDMRSLNGIEVKCKTPMARVEGVIHGVSLDTNMDALLKELKGTDQKVMHVMRLVNRWQKPSRAVKITFNLHKLPQAVAFWKVIMDVSPFTPSVKRCTKCQRIGHTKTQCRARLQRCVRCTCTEPTHDFGKCNKPEKCFNCGSNHSSAFKQCPVYIEWQEAVRIRASEYMPFPQALQRARESLQLQRQKPQDERNRPLPMPPKSFGERQEQTISYAKAAEEPKQHVTPKKKTSNKKQKTKEKESPNVVDNVGQTVDPQQQTEEDFQSVRLMGKTMNDPVAGTNLPRDKTGEKEWRPLRPNYATFRMQYIDIMNKISEEERNSLLGNKWRHLKALAEARAEGYEAIIKHFFGESAPKDTKILHLLLAMGGLTDHLPQNYYNLPPI